MFDLDDGYTSVYSISFQTIHLFYTLFSMCVTFKKGFKRELIPSIDKLYSHNKIMFKVQTSTS